MKIDRPTKWIRAEVQRLKCAILPLFLMIDRTNNGIMMYDDAWTCTRVKVFLRNCISKLQFAYVLSRLTARSIDRREHAHVISVTSIPLHINICNEIFIRWIGSFRAMPSKKKTTQECRQAANHRILFSKSKLLQTACIILPVSLTDSIIVREIKT